MGTHSKSITVLSTAFPPAGRSLTGIEERAGAPTSAIQPTGWFAIIRLPGFRVRVPRVLLVGTGVSGSVALQSDEAAGTAGGSLFHVLVSCKAQGLLLKPREVAVFLEVFAEAKLNYNAHNHLP